MGIATTHFDTLAGLVLAGGAMAASSTEAPMGWASQGGGTTGGAGGTVVTVKTMADLQKYAKASGKYVIWVDGTMGSFGTRGEGNGDRVTVSSDKSILGLPGAHVKGGFDLNGVKNVILRNLVVEGPGACDNDCGSAGEGRQDNITIVNGTTNVWLDHMDIFDGEDGNTDITKKSDFVTLSWVKFHYTDKSFPSGTAGKSHRFCNLLGGSDNPDKEGANNLSVTFYKTWWGEGVAERQPRVRFGKVHVANCLFNSNDPGQNHNIRAGYKANLLVEGNVFVGQKKPIDLYNNDFTAVTARNNVFTGCSGNTAGSGTAFTPPYTLPLSSTAALATDIMDAKTGSGATIACWDNGCKPTGIGGPHAAGGMLGSVSLERTPHGELLLNGQDHAVDAVLLDLAGREVGRSEVAAGSSWMLPQGNAGQMLRVTGKGATRTMQLPRVH